MKERTKFQEQGKITIQIDCQRLIITTIADATNIAYTQGNVLDALTILIHLILTMTLQRKC